MRYFTSDTHFGHPLVTVLRGFISNGRVASEYRDVRARQGSGAAEKWIRDYANHRQIAFRELADTAKHDKTLITNINSAVGAEDELWILGDVSFRTTIDYTLQCLRSLTCKHLHMIVGNHDRNFRNHTNDRLYQPVFESIDDYRELTMHFLDADQTVALSHFPRRSSIMQHIGTWGGDMRFRQDTPATEGWLLYGHTHQDAPAGTDPKSVNVGLDAWNLKPVSEPRIVAWFEHTAGPEKAEKAEKA